MIDVTQIKNLGDFLQYLAGPGSALIVLALISYFLEGTAWWDARKPKAKQLLFLTASLILALAGLWLGMVYVALPVEQQSTLTAVFLVVLSVGSAVLGPQIFHSVTKSPKEVVVEGTIIKRQ